MFGCVLEILTTTARRAQLAYTAVCAPVHWPIYERYVDYQPEACQGRCVSFDLTSDWRPGHGDFRHEFGFDPLPYGVGGERRDAFKSLVREEVKQYGFVLTGEVSVRWDLMVDEQDRWESDTGADVDNFAKLLDDAITGPNGIMIDDTQVQRLEVAWLPADGPAGFNLTIYCHQGEWSSRPLSLYELADGLWYPCTDSAVDVGPVLGLLLHRLDGSVHRVKRVRYHMREAGATRQRAFQQATYLAPSARGFHRTRAMSSGFPMVARSQWSLRWPRPADLPAADDDEFRRIAHALLGGP